MVEQNARQGLEASHRGYVMEQGLIAFEGDTADLLKDPEVCRAFTSPGPICARSQPRTDAMASGIDRAPAIAANRAPAADANS